MLVANVDLKIPAGATRHYHKATYKTPVPVTLLDATPHMHVLGRELKATAHQPDGQTVPLIWVKDWDFYWQDNYVYTEGVRLPAGTTIEVECWYDNSSTNLLNPHDPPQDVRWGDYSIDEMGICYFQATADNWDDFRRLGESVRNFFDREWQRYQRSRK
jgi:hypothetical protein